MGVRRRKVVNPRPWRPLQHFAANLDRGWQSGPLYHAVGSATAPFVAKSASPTQTHDASVPLQVLQPWLPLAIHALPSHGLRFTHSEIRQRELLDLARHGQYWSALPLLGAWMMIRARNFPHAARLPCVSGIASLAPHLASPASLAPRSVPCSVPCLVPWGELGPRAQSHSEDTCCASRSSCAHPMPRVLSPCTL